MQGSRERRLREAKHATLLQVNIDQESGLISVYNNGGGIPVEMHADEKCWVRSPHTLKRYRGTSLMRDSAPLGPYSRTMPRALWWS